MKYLQKTENWYLTLGTQMLKKKQKYFLKIRVQCF